MGQIVSTLGDGRCTVVILTWHRVGESLAVGEDRHPITNFPVLIVWRFSLDLLRIGMMRFQLLLRQ